MAFSSSVKRAQAIKLCELCDESTSLKWRCVDCDKCLCDKCKGFHLKVTAKHQIVSIKTLMQDIQREIISNNIPCEDHVSNMVCMFCETCDCPVCPDCISSLHRKHDFVPLEKILAEKRKHIKERQTIVTDKMKLYDIKTREIQNVNFQLDLKFEACVSIIKEREQELKDQIHKLSKILQDKAKVKMSKVKKAVTKVEQQVTMAKNMLEDQRNDTEGILVSNQGKDILEASLEIATMNLDSVPNETELFIPGDELTQELFGVFQNITLPRIQVDFRFEVLKTLTTDLRCIDNVVSLEDNSAWISSRYHRMIRQVDISDNNVTTTEEISSSNVQSIALSFDKDLLFSVSGIYDIKLRTKQGTVTPFLKVPMFPLAIHVSKNKDITVSVQERGYQRQWAIIVYRNDSKQIDRYLKYDLKGHKFQYPFRITTNTNGDILVIDGTSSNTGRIVCLDNEGVLRWIYSGDVQIELDEEFEPRGIATTSEGYILVTDFHNHALHVLSDDGELVTFKVMESLGIEFPWALDIDKEGQLWICCGHKEEPIEAKIHIVKFSI